MSWFVRNLACAVVTASASVGAAAVHRPSVPMQHGARMGESSEAVLHAFQGSDGAFPYASLIDRKGVLLGTVTTGNLTGGNRSGIFHGDGGVFALTPSASGYTESSVYGFLGYPNDGSQPNAGLVADRSGALYGTTYVGGSDNYGTVFKLTPSGAGYTERVIYSFQGRKGGTDGAFPNANLLVDSSGALYGTTEYGGSFSNACSYGCGTVFKLTPGSSSYTESVLYRFAGKTGDGHYPYGGVISDHSGALYGTTISGGSYGFGAAFKLSPGGSVYTEALMHSFSSGKDGAQPVAGLTLAKGGVLYGTTQFGGGVPTCTNGCGVVFALAPSSGGYSESIVYAFLGGNDGSGPNAGLIAGKKGVLYGTTLQGGGNSCGHLGCGTVFKIAPSGSTFTESVLYSFQGGSDGSAPVDSLIAAQGTLFGTTETGGGADCFGDDGPCGTVFRVAE